MSLDADAIRIASRAEAVLPLQGAALGDEYRYQSLPLCVIDAVFSIGVRYGSVQQVVARYCAFTGQRRVRAGIELPPVSEQETVGTFCDRPEQLDVQGMADRVYRNRQRTSSRGGILKADAVLRFARCLRQYGVATFQDLPRVATHAGFEAEIRAIPGQGSGIALSYFWMLAGSDDLIKPDRMIVRFLSNTLGREVGIGDAQDLLRAASSHLRRKHPLLTPRLLDYVVWKYQREVSEPVSAPIGG